MCYWLGTSKFPGPPEPSRHSEPLGPSGSYDHSRPYWASGPSKPLKLPDLPEPTNFLVFLTLHNFLNLLELFSNLTVLLNIFCFHFQGSLISFRLYKSTSWWTISWNLTYRQRHWKISTEGKTFFDYPCFDKYFHPWKQPHCHAYHCVHKFWNHAVKSGFSPGIPNLSLFAIIRP